MSRGNLSLWISCAPFPLLNESLSQAEEMLPPKILNSKEKFVATQRGGSSELDRGVQSVLTEPWQAQTAGQEYADNLERKDFAFMRSAEATLLFMG